jgi:hypothetical protein
MHHMECIREYVHDNNTQRCWQPPLKPHQTKSICAQNFFVSVAKRFAS